MFQQLLQRNSNEAASTVSAICIVPQQGAPQKLLLSISIPPGVSAGQTLGVKVPDGRELTVVVPPGASGGKQSHSAGIVLALTTMESAPSNPFKIQHISYYVVFVLPHTIEPSHTHWSRKKILQLQNLSSSLFIYEDSAT